MKVMRGRRPQDRILDRERLHAASEALDNANGDVETIARDLIVEVCLAYFDLVLPPADAWPALTDKVIEGVHFILAEGGAANPDAEKPHRA
jgi:hypothetical protein